MTGEVAVIPLLDELTPRQRAFVTHPQAITDPELAMIQSGYENRYARQYCRTLQRELWFYIQAGEAAAQVRRAITPTMVLDELNNLAFSDVLDFFHVVDKFDEAGKVTGSMLAPKQNLLAMQPYQRRLIKRIRTDTFVDVNGVGHVYISDIELHGKEWAIKEIIELLRLKQTGAPKDETAELLSHMDAKDLEQIEKLFTKAAATAKKQGSRKRDQDAFEG